MLKIKRIIKRLRDINYYNCIYNRLKLYVLYKIYHFDKWHTNAPFQCREYKKVLVKEINKLDIDNIAIEIGGGVG